jgi:hypothetical protein
MSDDSNITPFPPAGEQSLPANTSTDTPAATPPAPPDPDQAFSTKPGVEEYHFEESSGKFWLRNAAGVWVSLAEGGFKRHLKKLGKRDKLGPKEIEAGKAITQMDEEIRKVEQNHRVAFAGALAGYRAGIHKVAGRMVLVSEDPDLVLPMRGEWPTLKAYFNGLLIGEEIQDDEKGTRQQIDQTAHFYGWLQHVVDCLYKGRISSGLALCVAGERDSGKSRLGMILRWILGGRVAKPYAAMIGRDNFNRELFEAVLQLIDDENADTRIEQRLKFGAEIKKVVANDEVKQRGMHRDGITLSVLWRLVILVNLEPERLMVLPPIDSDIQDKLLMLKGYKRAQPAPDADEYTRACWPMPMPTRTEDEKEAFRARLRAELPAFLWWLLNEFKMPSHVDGGRFSVRHWQHPQIRDRLQQFSPHVRLWQFIESSRVVFEKYHEGNATDDQDRPGYRPVPEWTGTARELHDVLKSEKSQLTADEKRKVPDPAWIGQRLEAAREHFGEEVAKPQRSAKARNWRLKHKPGLVD